ncbi:MAG: class I SAM-dependent methyltransferase [Dethiobacteria bacterium]|nr:class I SAM-dependent methyltransferase [Dethiobacteria bacterium]
MDKTVNHGNAIARAYDEEAETSGWFGPEVAFGLTYAYIKPGQLLLDIGIGTGLGSVLFRKAGLIVHGMDIDPEMIEACRSKGFSDLLLHDLSKPPYPYHSESMDHVICSGVMNFFKDLSQLFAETARILRKGGLFAFIAGSKAKGDSGEFIVGAEHTGSDKPLTMYRHGTEQISLWIEQYGFELLRSLTFFFFMDRE